MWRPITEPPDRNGYVLVAGYHHRTIPVVSLGHAKVHRDSGPTFTALEHERNMIITHWQPLPEHPGEVGK